MEGHKILFFLEVEYFIYPGNVRMEPMLHCFMTSHSYCLLVFIYNTTQIKSGLNHFAVSYFSLIREFKGKYEVTDEGD